MANELRRGLLDRIGQLEASLTALRRELASSQEGAPGTFDALSFSVRDKTYGVFLADVVEVLRMVKWQPLPKAPPDIQGVINCRGAVIPVLNPGTIFSDSPVTPGVNNALIVLAAAGQSVALMVDQVLGVQSYSQKDLSQVGDAAHRTLPPYVVGFVKSGESHTSIVDINLLLSLEDQRGLSAALRERDEWGRL